jgi:tRNA-dihydrouridine synthase
MTAATGCSAVMVGRGALGAPWIFRGAEISRDERARIIRRHDALIEAFLPPRTAAIQLKKHLAWYASGYPGAARLRVEIFSARDSAEAREIFWGAW